VPRCQFVEKINTGTAAAASIGDLAECTAGVDARLRVVLREVMAQRRSTAVALDYVTALGSVVKANCWSLAEAADHDRQSRLQGLLGSYRWDWTQLRGRLTGLAAAWIPGTEADLIGPGIAIDETAHLKKGDATACVGPQHAGCTGTVENCVSAP
jgi:SRSO17 transposase